MRVCGGFRYSTLLADRRGRFARPACRAGGGPGRRPAPSAPRCSPVVAGAEQALYQDTLAEYCWARDVAGLPPTTLNRLVQPVIEVCTFHDVQSWELSPRQLDQYLARAGKRGHTTVRKKITSIDLYCAFLEQPYVGRPAVMLSVTVHDTAARLGSLAPATPAPPAETTKSACGPPLHSVGGADVVRRWLPPPPRRGILPRSGEGARAGWFPAPPGCRGRGSRRGLGYGR